MSRTRFVSKCSGIWHIEVKSSAHAGTLVEATTELADANPNDRNILTSTKPNTMTDGDTGHHMPPKDDENTLRQERKNMEDKLEREHTAIEDAKEDLASEERAQMFKMATRKRSIWWPHGYGIGKKRPVVGHRNSYPV